MATNISQKIGLTRVNFIAIRCTASLNSSCLACPFLITGLQVWHRQTDSVSSLCVSHMSSLTSECLDIETSFLLHRSIFRISHFKYRSHGVRVKLTAAKHTLGIWPIADDDDVAWCVNLSVTWLCFAKTSVQSGELWRCKNDCIWEGSRSPNSEGEGKWEFFFDVWAMFCVV